MSELNIDTTTIQRRWDTLLAERLYYSFVLSALYETREFLGLSHMSFYKFVEFLKESGIKRLPLIVDQDQIEMAFVVLYKKMPISAWLARALPRHDPVKQLVDLSYTERYNWLQDKNTIKLRRRLRRGEDANMRRREKARKKSAVFIKARELDKKYDWKTVK
jgi:hypothetical protein